MTITNSIIDPTCLTNDHYILSAILSGASQDQSDGLSKDTDEQSAYMYSPEELELVETFDEHGSFHFLAEEHDLSLQENFDQSDIQELLDHHQSEALELWNGSQADEPTRPTGNKVEIVNKSNKEFLSKLQYSQRNEISGDLLSIENELAMFENGFDTTEAADIVQSQQNDLMHHLGNVKHANSDNGNCHSYEKEGGHLPRKSCASPSTSPENESYSYDHDPSVSPDCALATLQHNMNYYHASPATSTVDQFGNPYQGEAQIPPNHPLQYEFLEHEAQKTAYELYAKQAYMNSPQNGHPMNMESMEAFMSSHPHARQMGVNYYLQHLGQNYDPSANHSPSELHPYLSLQHGDLKSWYAMGHHHYHPYAPYPMHGYSHAGPTQSNSMGHAAHSAHLTKSGRAEDVASKRTAKVQKKKNVGRACVHCKKAHLACDESRPCKRCVHLGKSFCVDVEHKRRGRPKLSANKKSAPISKESPYLMEPPNAPLESL
ncbi:hypothetical protein K493DRAFT_344859 [Basidiobolus meristosporus CBS 931.73]|uniref:Zn(2)-C6 fungal-type domain-containing protein n=1 Tax=Basidiobolus meristosporus CBS 931.73 TaxID=1314790 RepID=A0A1Y1Z6Y0_9FUNG|nr:hypothetical protein K493DRAFT_344859 [Basidiobolus meristosporus CBS 931.73]|eukprot:ORY05757.1 hypothetical protein K493DRAFT_344859 [Basidiobolus meristosporus CBS 931.73]